MITRIKYESTYYLDANRTEWDTDCFEVYGKSVWANIAKNHGLDEDEGFLITICVGFESVTAGKAKSLKAAKKQVRDKLIKLGVELGYEAKGKRK